MESVRGIVGKRSLGIGKLRPRIVLYNEFNPDADAIGAVTSADLKARPDALLVVGTSLKIPGVKRIVREMCGVVQDYRGGLTVWINEDDPPSGREFEGAFDLIVRGDCEKVAKLANMPRWDGSEPPPQEEDAPDSDSGVSISSEHEPTRAMCRVVEVQIPQTNNTTQGKGNVKKRSAPETKEKNTKKAKTTKKPKCTVENPQKTTGLKKFITKVKKAGSAMKKEAKPKNTNIVIPKLAAISISRPVPATPTDYVHQIPQQSTIYIPSPTSPTSSSGLSSPMDIKSLLNP